MLFLRSVNHCSINNVELDVRIRDIHTNITLESNELKKMSVPYREDNNCEEECTYKNPD